jgi:Domain of unknown function (DUF4372)/Transposase DDE domain
MNAGRTVFAQLIEYLPSKEFQKCVARYSGDSRFRGFSCWDQLLAMSFAQLTYRESLRDIEACLRSMSGKLYHMGLRGKVARSTLGDANEAHDWRIYADFAQVLIGIARPLHARDPIGVDLSQSLYALDSTTIDLCLSLFPWAKFRRRKAAVKMHTLLDLHGNIPTFISITDGKVHDVNILDEIMPEAGAFYVMDRGYVDFERLCLHAERGLLRRKEQIKCDTPAPLLTSSGQNHRRSIRSHSHPDGHRLGHSLSGRPASRQLSRRGNKEAVQVPHQQLHASGAHHRADLQIALAGGTVLQVDQAAPPNQGLLWDQRECREDPNLDRRVGLRPGGHHPQASHATDQPLPDSTDSERDAF